MSLCLNSILALNLFVDTPTSVLKAFDAHTARDIALATNRLVTMHTNINAAIPSTRHMDWVIECTGYVFALTVSDFDAIVAARDLYFNW